MPGTPAKSVVQTDEHGLLGPLKDSLAEAMHKFQPDRSQAADPGSHVRAGRRDGR